VPLLRSSLPAFALSVLSLGALAAAQGFVPAGQRDAVQMPTERRVPVGTSSISGTIVTGDTGRPVRGARVTVSGQVPANAAVPGTGRSGPLDGSPVNVGPLVGGVRGGIPGGAVQVTMGGGTPSSLSRHVFADENGQFSFPRLPAGNFTISVFQNQFLQVNYGQKRVGGPGKTISLADGQQLTLKIPMLRGGVITGTVLGPDGEPQSNAQVRGSRYDTSSGFKRLQSVAFAQADDRGRYRMFGLQPGEYVISAIPIGSDAMNAARQVQEADLVEQAIVSGQVRPPSAPGLTPTVAVPIAPPMSPGQMQMMGQQYLPTYAPSSPLASGANKVTVAGGEESAGVDILVRLTLASSIQGVVTTPVDSGVAIQLMLMSDDPTIDIPQGNSARVDQNGKFMFRAVAPGKYTVFAQTVPGQPPMTLVNGQMVGPQPQPIVLTDAQKMWGKAQVMVAGEPQIDVSVSLEPARSISGIVVFDMAKPPDLTRSRIMLTVNPAPAPQQMFFGQPPQAQVGPDGRFMITGVMPGRIMIRGSGLVMKSAVVGGQDTLDFPLEFTGERDVTDAVLTFTDTPTELSGTLMDAAGKPATDMMIVVAASDNRYWTPGSRRIVVARPSPDGRYTIRSLPPGAYVIAAVNDLENGGQYDPEFLRTLSAVSVPVTIMEGAKVSQDLRVK
jgi:hypothetical protein